MNRFCEDTRHELVARARRAEREKDGRTRYNKRLTSRVGTSTQQYNRIDMNQLFKDDILTIQIGVIGETDNYTVKISYGGVLDALANEIRRNKDRLELRSIIRALVIAFNKNEVYINCSCPD